MAEFEKRLACVIKADGAIARGYMIDKCEFDGVNAYTITWKIPLQGVAKSNFAGTIGSAAEEPEVGEKVKRIPRQVPVPDAGTYLRSQRQARCPSLSHRLLP